MDIVTPVCVPSVMSMTKKQLHELVRGSPQRLLDKKLQDLDQNLIDITKCPAEKSDELKKSIKKFKVLYKRKWLACNSAEARFLEKNKEWLGERVILPSGPIPGSSKGRPTKEFGESSEQTKHRKTIELRKSVPVEVLTYAAQMSHRAAGNSDVAKVIKDVTKTPTRAKKFRKAAALGSKTTTTNKHTPEKALVIFVEADLTMSQYEVIHQANKDVAP